MKKIIILSLFCLALGCVSTREVRTDYVEGTSVVVGLLVPVNGNLVGIQAFTYLSGKRLRSSDTNVVIKTSHSLTNQAFGCSVSDQQETEIGRKSSIIKEI